MQTQFPKLSLFAERHAVLSTRELHRSGESYGKGGMGRQGLSNSSLFGWCKNGLEGQKGLQDLQGPKTALFVPYAPISNVPGGEETAHNAHNNIVSVETLAVDPMEAPKA